jgi:hypothetical protein
MNEGICARVALAGLAGLVVLAGGCSQSPAPVTRKSDAGGATPAIQQAPGATAASTANPASSVTPALPPSTVPHSSEAEPKSSAITTPVAAPPLVSASPPAAPAGAPAGPLGAAAPAGASAAQTAPAAPAVAGSSLAGAALPQGADAPAPVAVRSAPASAAPGLVIPIDAPAGRRSDPSVVVVDAADPDPDSKLSLVDAAKAERERKAEAPPPRIVINNKNLHAYAKGGQLTIAEPRKKGSAAGPASPAAANAANAAASAPAAAPGTVAPLERDEKYWRGRALEIRQRWRKAADRIKELEGDVNLWRRRFYAEDDPYVRDGQIKPSWDRALDDLRENHEAVAAAKKELDDFLEEGRRAGALPGWLREGNELEPKEEKPVDPLQPTATPIYKEPGR